MIKAQFSKAIAAAAGNAEYDLVIKNVNYVNLFTKEIYTADIGIADGIISRVTQPGDEPLECKNIYNAKGKYAIPGLIDTHVHIESSMMNPGNMAKAILPHGTTTIGADPHEIGNVAGIEGVKYMLEASENIPLSVFILAPSCVPSAMGVETSGAFFGAKEMEEIFNLDKRVLGLGEVMDYPGVINQQERISDIIATIKERGVFLQGHCPTLKGAKLNAYQASGVNSDHETGFTEEAVYKLRAGMTLECRESSIAKNIKALMPAVKKFNYPPNVTLCTDDREPDDLINIGHIDNAVRRCVEEGADIIEVIKIATYNASRLLRLYDRGSLIPGMRADIVLLDELNPFTVNEVFVKGELTAKDGKMYKDFKVPEHPFEKINSVHIDRELTPDDFKIKVDTDKPVVNMNIIKSNRVSGSSLTNHLTQDIPVKDGFAVNNDDDLITVAVFERHGKKGSSSACFVKNTGLREGAVASTISHDCHNLVIFGKNPEDMAKAANNVIKGGGGFSVVKNGKEIANLSLPIGGLMSPLSVEEMAPLTKKLKEAIASLGLYGNCPIIQVGSMALPVIPEIRITDLGLVDVASQEFIPLINE